MKFIKSKLLQKSKGRKRGKYLITLEVTDYDLEMLEDLYMTDLNWLEKNRPKQFIRIQRWTYNLWITFWKLWHLYDEND